MGAALIVLGCLGGAYLYLEGLQNRIEILKEWREILEEMEGEIRYGKISLPECFACMGRQNSSVLRQCLGELSKEMEANPQKDLREELEKKLQGRLQGVFTEGERKDLFCFLAFQGCRDELMQQKLLHRNREYVEEYLNRWRGEYRGKGKVAFSLGAMMGIVLVLLLI